jgi:hypothetical protein
VLWQSYRDRLSVADSRGSSAKVIAMAINTSSDAIDSLPSSTSLSGLDGVNFFSRECSPDSVRSLQYFWLMKNGLNRTSASSCLS